MRKDLAELITEKGLLERYYNDVQFKYFIKKLEGTLNLLEKALHECDIDERKQKIIVEKLLYLVGKDFDKSQEALRLYVKYSTINAEELR